MLEKRNKTRMYDVIERDRNEFRSCVEPTTTTVVDRAKPQPAVEGTVLVHSAGRTRACVPVVPVDHEDTTKSDAAVVAATVVLILRITVAHGRPKERQFCRLFVGPARKLAPLEQSCPPTKTDWINVHLLLASHTHMHTTLLFPTPTRARADHRVDQYTSPPNAMPFLRNQQHMESRATARVRQNLVMVGSQRLMCLIVEPFRIPQLKCCDGQDETSAVAVPAASQLVK
jgi:hypothetical protein